MFKKTLFPIAISLIGTFIVATLWFGKSAPEMDSVEEQPVPVKVEAVKVEAQTLRLSVKTQGTVKPKRQIDVIAQVSGPIISVQDNFVDGGFFENNQSLLQIDDRPYRQALLHAQASLASAQEELVQEEAQAHQAKLQWRELGNDQSNRLFLRQPQLLTAKARVASATADVEIAKLDIERTRIRIPFSGRIKKTAANFGQHITQGSQIASAYDSSVMEIRVPITEHQATLLDLPLQPISGSDIQTKASVIIRGSVAGVVGEWSGTLVRSDAFVDEQSRLYYAIVEVKNLSNAVLDNTPPLLPGMFVEVEISGKAIDNVIVLPRSALVRQDVIAIIENDKADTNNDDKKITLLNVNVLKKTQQQVWLTADISGDVIVAIEKQSLTPAGTVVEPLLPGTLLPNTSLPDTLLQDPENAVVTSKTTLKPQGS